MCISARSKLALGLCAPDVQEAASLHDAAPPQEAGV